MRLKRLTPREGFRVVRGNRPLAGRRYGFIAHGERHEIKNTGRSLLRTLNFYVPPAYRQNGEPLARGRK